MEKLGFVGLGTMGGPMCSNLLGAGYDVIAFDLDPGALQAQIDNGAVAAESAAELAGQVDVLLTSLPRPDHVVAVMQDGGVLEALQPGALWIDLTTNRIELLKTLAASAPDGVDIVDSPVTGAVDGARNATMTLFLGGADEAVGRAQPILDHLGKVIVCGELGSGNVVKLVTNQLWFIHAAALGEGFALGLANGVGIDVLWEAIKESVGDSFVARHDAPSIFAGHYDPSFTLDLCLKDLGLIGELNKQVAADLMMTTAAHEAFTLASERYGAASGELHVAKRIEDDANLSFRLAGDWTPHWEK
ncbi:MAG: NAD(P)-dependent oxidoreductase [Acidimicrobiales bacterium]